MAEDNIEPNESNESSEVVKKSYGFPMFLRGDAGEDAIEAFVQEAASKLKCYNADQEKKRKKTKRNAKK